ncbi:MAG: hypothetical protein GXO69_09475 [Acidobacteria bacterium]|nr:hypothetical protein [Acidobacteriota bacterium]
MYWAHNKLKGKAACLFFACMSLMWGCGRNSPGLSSVKVVKIPENGACQRILEGEEIPPMTGLVYSRETDTVSGVIRGSGYRCNYGRINLKGKPGFDLLGECGQGPGEFQAPVNSLSSDGIFTYVRDINPRILVLDEDGHYAGTFYGIHPYQIKFNVSGDKIFAEGIDDSTGYIVVSEYRIASGHDLIFVRDVAVIRDWRNRISASRVSSKAVVPPTQIVWVGNHFLFIGDGLWSQYILVNLTTGNWQYRDIYLSVKKAETRPNRSVGNYMAAFELDGKIALLEDIHRPIRVNGRKIKQYYVVDIQEPLKKKCEVFNPLFSGCSDKVDRIIAFDAVGICGARQFSRVGICPIYREIRIPAPVHQIHHPTSIGTPG